MDKTKKGPIEPTSKGNIRELGLPGKIEPEPGANPDGNVRTVKQTPYIQGTVEPTEKK